MNLKLKTLEDFLRKKGFCAEAEACSRLNKVAIPLLDNPFVGKKTDFKVTREDRDKMQEHGWVYVLMTEPTLDSNGNKNAEQGWYVGSTGSPAIRWIEHFYGTKRAEDDTYTIPSPSELENMVMSAIEKEEHIKGSKFTSKYNAKEIVCMELIDFNPDVYSDSDGRKKREREVFRELAEIVGWPNIGGDFNLMLWANKNKESLPPKYINEAEIKSQIKTIVSCDKASVLTSALNALSYEDVTDSDLSYISKRRKWFDYARRDETKRRREIYNDLASLSDSEVEEKAGYIQAVYEETDDMGEVLRILNLESKGAFLSTLSALNLNWKEMKDNKERAKIISALNSSDTFSEAKGVLGLSATSPALSRKMDRLGIDGREELGKKLRHQDAHFISYIENLLRNSRTFTAAVRGSQMTPHNLERFMERNNLSKDLLGIDLAEALKEALRESRTKMEAAKRLGVNRGWINSMAGAHNINIAEELGRNFREEEPIVSYEEEGF